MIVVPGYLVMGEDGKEYGPASPEEIRRWVAEGRMNRQTPLKNTEAGDWIFLGEVAEFKDLFAPPPISPPARQGTRREVVIAAIFIVLLAGLYLLLKNFSHH